MYKKNKVFLFILVGIFVLGGMLQLNNSSFSDTIEQKNLDAPKVDGSNYTPQREKNSNYIESKNSYDDGGAKYYLLTQDVAKAGFTEITYKGKTYQLESVQVKTANDDLSGVTFTNKDGSSAGKLFNAGGSNATVFIDDGTYKFSLYTGLSGANNSYVGLSDVDVSAGEDPKVIIHKTKYPASGWSASYAGQERILLVGRNTYIENIAFDGQNRDMNPNWVKKNRGDALIFINGNNSSDSMNMVMKDIVIQNVGASTSSTAKNKGLELFCVPGQSNFENIKFKNIKTSRALSPLHIEEPDNANFKNIDVDMSATHSLAYPIKVETASYHADTNIKGALASASDQTVIFAGKINFSDRKDQDGNESPLNAIYVERYQYDKVEVPEDFKWAIWCQENGNDIKPSFLITQNYPVKDAETGATSFGGYTTDLVLHDLRDDYWVIDYGKFAKSQSSADKRKYIEQELDQILRVIKYTTKNELIPAKGRDPYTDEATVGTNKANVPRAPRAKIKIVGNLIPGFTVPEGYADYDTDIVAVDSKEDLYSSKDLVPFENWDKDRTDLTTVSGINLPTPKDKTMTLYNFDFHKLANYTLHESVNGISELTKFVESTNGTNNLLELNDPLEKVKVAGGTDLLEEANRYSKYFTQKIQRVKNSKYETFVNCNFTVLNAEINITNEPKDNKVQMGTTHTLGKETIKAYTFDNKGNIIGLVDEIDDPDTIWVSGDPNIATINQNGVITPVKSGEVWFYLKSIDKYNQGEIERPFDSVKIIIEKEYKAIHKFISATEGKELPASVKGLLPKNKENLKDGTKVKPTEPEKNEVKVKGGKWVFKGYDKKEAIINKANETFVGEWIFEEDVVIEKEYTTNWVDEDGKVLKDPVTDKTTKEKGSFEGYTYVKTTTDKNGNVTHIFKKVVVEKEYTTNWVDEDGKVLKDPVTDKTTKEKGSFEGYTYVKTTTDKNGNVTHIFKKVVVEKECTTNWVDENGKVLKDPVTDKTTKEKGSFEGYTYVKTTTDKNGNVTHHFKKVVEKKVTTNWVDEDGKVLKDPVTDKTTKEKGSFEGYTYVKTTTDKNGNVTHIFKKVVVEKECTTNWVDENGKVLKDPVTDKTTKEKGSFEGYTYVKTTTDKNGNVTHHFKKVVEKKVTTNWVDEDGKVLKDPVTDKTTKEKGSFEGYVYVKTTTDKNGNVTHHFKKVVEKKVTTNWVDENGKVLKDPVTDVTIKDAGTIEGYTFVEKKTDENGNVTYIFKKKLPKTGSSSNTIYYGVSMMLVGLYLFYVSRKKVIN